MLNKEEQKEIKKDLEVLINIKTLSETDGGKELVKRLNQDIRSTLSIMLEKRNSFTLQDYTASVCDIKSKLDIIKIIDKAKDNIEMLENVLKEQEE